MRTSDVARMIGLQPAMIRRHAQTYESVFGGIEQDTNGRKYDNVFVNRLQEALRACNEDGTASSVQEALEKIKNGSPIKLIPEQTKEDLILELIRKQGETIQALERKVSVVTQQLEDDKDSRIKELEVMITELKSELDKEKRPWWKVW